MCFKMVQVADRVNESHFWNTKNVSLFFVLTSFLNSEFCYATMFPSLCLIQQFLLFDFYSAIKCWKWL